MITREVVAALFEELKTMGVPTEIELLCGYFFHARNRKKLEAAVPLWQNQGYRFVEISSNGWLFNKNYVLHVERIENHSIDWLLLK